MFFKFAKSSASVAREEAQQSLDAQREEINRRMSVINDVNIELAEAARKTQEMSTVLKERINKEIKFAKKSFTSISSKLHEGMAILDHTGRIVHLNTAAAKTLGLDEKQVIGKHLDELIQCGVPLFNNDGEFIQKPILMKMFFEDLSNKIFERLTTNCKQEKYLVCTQALRDEIPFCVETELDMILGVRILCNGIPHSLTVSLTVLDNDPDRLQDISYVFLFSDHK